MATAEPKDFHVALSTNRQFRTMAAYLRALAKSGDIQIALRKVKRTESTRRRWLENRDFREAEQAVLRETATFPIRHAVERAEEAGHERRRLEHPGPYREFRARYFGERGITWPHMDPWIEVYETPSIRRCIIVGPPNIGRTTVMHVQRYAHMAAIEAWRYYQSGESIDFPLRAASISSVGQLAENFLWQLARYLTDPAFGGDLIRDYGPFKGIGRESRWSAKQLYLAWRDAAEKDPSFQASGVGRTLQSSRLTDLTMDDADRPSNSELERRRILREIDQVYGPRVNPYGRLWYLCNRVSYEDMDVATTLLRRGQRGTWKAVVQSAVVPFGAWPGDPDARSVWPEHVSMDDLIAAREEMENDQLYACVYLAMVNPGDSGVFERDRLEMGRDSSRTLGSIPPGTRRIMGLDPAPSGPAALMMYAVDPATKQRYVVDHEWEPNPGPLGMEKWVKDYCLRYHPERLIVEKVGGSAEFKELPELKRWLRARGCVTVELPTGRNKHDPKYGVPAMAGLFHSPIRVSFPDADAAAQEKTDRLINQLARYTDDTDHPIDLPMAMWKCESGARKWMRNPVQNSSHGDARDTAPWIANRQQIIRRMA